MSVKRNIEIVIEDAIKKAIDETQKKQFVATARVFKNKDNNVLKYSISMKPERSIKPFIDFLDNMLCGSAKVNISVEEDEESGTLEFCIWYPAKINFNSAEIVKELEGEKEIVEEYIKTYGEPVIHSWDTDYTAMVNNNYCEEEVVWRYESE